MPITTNIASSNPPHSLQHYAMKFVSDLQIIWWSLSVICGRSVVFSRYSDSSTNKTDLHNMTEILFKVALYTITLSLFRSAIISVLQLSLFRSAFNSEAIQFPHISPSQCHLFILLNLSWKYRNWYTAYLMLNDNQSINQAALMVTWMPNVLAMMYGIHRYLYLTQSWYRDSQKERNIIRSDLR